MSEMLTCVVFEMPASQVNFKFCYNQNSRHLMISTLYTKFQTPHDHHTIYKIPDTS